MHGGDEVDAAGKELVFADDKLTLKNKKRVRTNTLYDKKHSLEVNLLDAVLTLDWRRT